MTDITAQSGLLTRTKLHVDDTGGSGRPVVLIHGWPLSGRSWNAQVDALSDAGYRVVRYDRRGFGRSDKPKDGYDYDTLAEDLHKLLEELDLTDVTLVGFSMGGGEVARYVANHGQERLHSAVFAGAITPYLLQSGDNPDGPLTADLAAQMRQALEADRESFFDQFTTQFFSVGEELKVSEADRKEALVLCLQSDETAALGCMEAWGTTDFRDDLTKVTVPTLVIHGAGDGVVPFEGSGARTHAAIPHSERVVVDDAPHGFNVSHAGELNDALLTFLAK